MINAVSDAFHSTLSATSPNANFLCQSAARVEEILFFKGCAIEFLPSCHIGNFYGKLNLIFVPFINPPILTTLTATAEADPIPGFQFIERLHQFSLRIHFY